MKAHLQTSIFVPSITYLGTHRAHTLLYLRCTWTMLGTVFTNHYTAMNNSRIVSCWFSKTSSTTCTVFTCSWSAGLKGVIFMMDANPLLNSVHPLPKWCGHSTPSLTGSEFQGWKCCAYINCVTSQSFLHDRFSTIITTAHKCIPTNSMVKWLLHHLLQVTSITVSTSYHKIKGLLNKNYSHGNVTYWTGFIHSQWTTTLRNILTPFSIGLWR